MEASQNSCPYPIFLSSFYLFIYVFVWSSCEVFEESVRRYECSLCLWLPGILYSHSCPHLAFRNGLKFLPPFVLSSLATGRFSLGHASAHILFLPGSSFSPYISGQLFALRPYVSDGFKKVLNLLIVWHLWLFLL